MLKVIFRVARCLSTLVIRKIGKCGLVLAVPKTLSAFLSYRTFNPSSARKPVCGMSLVCGDWSRPADQEKRLTTD